MYGQFVTFTYVLLESILIPMLLSRALVNSVFIGLYIYYSRAHVNVHLKEQPIIQFTILPGAVVHYL